MRNATLFDVLHETKQIRKQTLESAQNGLEIIFKPFEKFSLNFLISLFVTRANLLHF